MGEPSAARRTLLAAVGRMTACWLLAFVGLYDFAPWLGDEFAARSLPGAVLWSLYAVVIIFIVGGLGGAFYYMMRLFRIVASIGR